jgi:hypothetical protein
MSKEKPILFSTEMVQAILAGNKTMTRRVIKPQSRKASGFFVTHRKSDNAFTGVYDYDENESMSDNPQKCPYGEAGDILWVKETLKRIEWADGIDGIAYTADDEPVWDLTRPCRWVWKNKTLSSRFMPKSIARIWLEVINIRVERLQDISQEDIGGEGLWHYSQKYREEICINRDSIYGIQATRRKYFKELWDSINERRGFSWESNPFVWIVEFEVVTP